MIGQLLFDLMVSAATSDVAAALKTLSDIHDRATRASSGGTKVNDDFNVTAE